MTSIAPSAEARALAADVQAFETWLRAHGVRSAHTVRAYLGHVRRMLESGDEPSAWATARLAEAPAGTAGQLRAAVRRWAEYAGQPAPELPRGARAAHRTRTPMDDSELEVFYRRVTHAPRMLAGVRTLLLLLPRTGLRVSEACGLRVEDLRRSGATSHVRVRGKGRTTRDVPLTREAQRVLDAYLSTHRAPTLPPRAWLLAGEGEDQVRADTVRVALRRLRRGATWTPHVLRHTFASRYYAATRDLMTLGQILGHRSLETTRIYVGTSLRERAAGMEAAELRKGAKRR